MPTKNTLAPVVQGLVDAIAFSLTISAFAYAGATQDPPPFESLDRNTDQRLSRSEASHNRLLAEVFAASDLDRDGFVSRAEYGRAFSDAASRQPAPPN